MRAAAISWQDVHNLFDKISHVTILNLHRHAQHIIYDIFSHTSSTANKDNMPCMVACRGTQNSKQMKLSLISNSMKSDCTTRRVTAYFYPFPRVACEAPASVITDTEEVGATPKNLNKSALFNLCSPLVIVVESLAAGGWLYASLNILIWHEICIESHIAIPTLMWRTYV